MRLFIDKHVKQLPTKRKTMAKHAKQRNFVYSYKLPISADKEINVCKKMFLATIGRISDSVIMSHFNSKRKCDGNSYLYDMRGESSRLLCIAKKNSLDELIKSHIESYNPLVTPIKRYLPRNLNVSKMWKDFCASHNKVTYEKYRQVFLTLNIVFKAPTEDESPNTLKGPASSLTENTVDG